MTESDFEGTIILERLSETGTLDEFYEAIDNDDFQLIQQIMRDADIDDHSISMVINLIQSS